MGLLRSCLAWALTVPSIAAAGAATGASAAVAAPQESAPAAVLEFAAEPGAFPVDGRSGRWAAPGYEVSVWEFEGSVKIDAATWDNRDWIRVELHAPAGRPLTVGDYPDVRHAGQRPDEVGILVISNGLGCGDDHAEVTVEDIGRGVDGTLQRLDATVLHRCGSDRPPLRATVHFQA